MAQLSPAQNSSPNIKACAKPSLPTAKLFKMLPTGMVRKPPLPLKGTFISAPATATPRRKCKHGWSAAPYPLFTTEMIGTFYSPMPLPPLCKNSFKALPASTIFYAYPRAFSFHLQNNKKAPQLTRWGLFLLSAFRRGNKILYFPSRINTLF